MPGINPSEWLSILEAASQRAPDECNAEWEWLMEQLGLGPEYFLSIYEAIRQGRWREAQNPKAYIKTVAKREAARMERQSRGGAELVFPGETQLEGEPVSQCEVLDSMMHQQDSVKPIKGADGIWRSGRGSDRDFEERSYRDLLLAGVPDEFTRVELPSEELEAVMEEINASREFHIHLDPLERPEWAKWAEAAELDEGERQVLEYKLKGMSRERALKAQPDEEAGKALQAAWKRFDRNGRQRLLAAAKKILAKNVPE